LGAGVNQFWYDGMDDQMIGQTIEQLFEWMARGAKVSLLS